jgi:hypothetical protein
MNITKHKHILFIIIILIAGVFATVRAMSVNAQNSKVVVARLTGSMDIGSTPNTVLLIFDFVANNYPDNVTIETPISASSREMNRSIREAFENFIVEPPGNPILGKNDTLILLGGAEKL